MSYELYYINPKDGSCHLLTKAEVWYYPECVETTKYVAGVNSELAALRAEVERLRAERRARVVKEGEQ